MRSTATSNTMHASRKCALKNGAERDKRRDNNNSDNDQRPSIQGRKAQFQVLAFFGKVLLASHQGAQKAANLSWELEAEKC
mmetsp:Transcript_10282/g.22713  ORF Transcript_10282/g.22713 Transcript_10282/m.22713 type:complete len:81 (+) Transcript_10282:494-736(+)